MVSETEALILEQLRELKALVETRLPKKAKDERKLPEHPMSPEEFGKVVGRSSQTVRRWIASGRLKAKQDCTPWLITPVNARKFLEGGAN